MNKKRGYDWLFKVTFTLPGTLSTVEGDSVNLVMKSAAADDAEKLTATTSLTDSGNLSGTTVTAYIQVAKATTGAVTLGDYVAEAYYQVAGATTKQYTIGETIYITVIDAVKDVPS